MNETSTKVTADHLARDAYLYVRQSSLHQVAHNTESSRRQYDLRGRAVALGWPADRVVVIDVDQGISGASAADREGFQRLVADVSLGKAGIVLGLECSRLARNNADWHQLLQLCSFTGTLICDEDGLYDPSVINDRLLLGLKGTMSEAELHFLRARLQGGLLAKARRGELALRLPIGFVYDGAGAVRLDPDVQVQRTIAHLFSTFERTGSAQAVVKAMRAEGVRVPARHLGGPRHGELYWVPVHHSTVLFTLHNPRYAGCYFYGRRRQVTGAKGRPRTEMKPRDEWTVFLPTAHDGYITMEAFEANQATLAANAAARGEDRRAGPVREGPALLQGLVVCGRCGRRMTVGYHRRCDGTLVPDYACQSQGIAHGRSACQRVGGAGIDAAVAALVLAELTPVAIEAAFEVAAELSRRAQDADRIRRAGVERARQDAEAARRRYLAVDPTNRLVAETLEADWNAALRVLAEEQDAYERSGSSAPTVLDDERQARVRSLVHDLPALWRDPATPMRERKRLIRLLVTDVTVVRGDQQTTAHVRLTGGATRTLEVPRPLTAWEQHTTPVATVALIDELLDDHPYDEVVGILNERGLTGGWGRPFSVPSLAQLCRLRGIPDHRQRLRAAGMLTLEEIAGELGVTPQTVKTWQRRGDITGQRVDGRRECLYHPGQHRPPDGRTMRSARRTGVTSPRDDGARPSEIDTSLATSQGGAV